MEDADIWSIDESSTGDEQLQRDDNLFDLFSHFGSEQSLVPDNTKQSVILSFLCRVLNFRAIELWSGLHVVEETNALNFRWNSSQLYSHFIEALNSYGAQGSAADSSVPKTGSLVSEGFSVNRSIDGGLNEWTLPEYGQNNEIDWDFFQTESNRSGPSVLDQELKALGLAPQPKRQCLNPFLLPHSSFSSITKPALNGTTNHKETHVNPRYINFQTVDTKVLSV